MSDKKFVFLYCIIYIGVVLSALFVYVSCTTPTTTTPTTTTPATAITQSVDESCIRIWTDPETNIQYIIYREKIGYAGLGCITPRLNEDGTLYVVPIEEGRD